MIYESELTKLIEGWKKDISTNLYDDSYRAGILDCIDDAELLLSNHYSQESQDTAPLFTDLPDEEIRKYLDDMEADNYLATIEAHENYAA